MKRRYAAGLAALTVAIVVWRNAARSATSAPSAGRDPTTVAAAAREIDPRSAARASISGQVTADGKPLRGARVCADPLPNAALPSEVLREASCADTDERGGYAIDELVAADYHVTASARGRRPAIYHPAGESRLRLVAGERASAIDLALRGGGAEVTGTVSDIGGGPIAHAQVRAAGAGELASDVMVETDERGAFTLSVDAGAVTLAATVDGYAEQSATGAAPGRIDLRLTPESSLAGTVLDAASGQPVADARVVIVPTDWHASSAEAISDATGAFHVDRLAPGRYAITARGAHAYGAIAGTILVGLGEHASDLTVEVQPAFRVEARVTSSDRPCADASASLEDVDHARRLDTETGPDGTLHVDGVLPGTYRVAVVCPGFVGRDHYPTVEVTDRDVTGLAWPVDVGAVVRGRITLDGAPLGDAQVEASGTSWASAVTAADGRYELRGLVAGSYRVIVKSELATAPEPTELDVAAQAAVDYDVELARAGTVRGTVVDAGGTPIAGVEVRLREPTRADPTARTLDDGSFVLAPVPPGDLHLVVSYGSRYETLRRPGSSDDEDPGEPVTVTAGHASPARIVVDAPAETITGVVIDPAGRPVSDAFVELITGYRGSIASVLTGDDGAFRFPNLRRASFAVTARLPGVGEATVREVEPGQPVRVQLAAHASLEGIARGPGGAPAELTVAMSGATWRSETFFHTGGRFAIHDLPPGNYTLALESESGRLERAIELTAGAHETLDLTLAPVMSVTARVVRADTHAPIAGIRVTGRFSGTSENVPGADTTENVSDASGRVTFRRVHGGHLELRCDGQNGYSTTWLERDVTGSDLGELELAPPAPDE